MDKSLRRLRLTDWENAQQLASIVSLWRNRLARSAVNRKVGGSNPPRDASFWYFAGIDSCLWSGGCSTGGPTAILDQACEKHWLGKDRAKMLKSMKWRI